MAAREGHAKVCEVLLRCNTDKTIKDSDGKTAAEYAKTKETKNMILNYNSKPSVSTVPTTTVPLVVTSNINVESSSNDSLLLTQVERIVKQIDSNAQIRRVEDLQEWIDKMKQEMEELRKMNEKLQNEVMNHKCPIMDATPYLKKIEKLESEKREVNRAVVELREENEKLKRENSNEVLEWRNVEDVSKVGTLIGKSQFEVYKMNDRDSVAKVIPLNPMKPEDYKQVKNEIEVMNKLFTTTPPPIVKIKAYSMDEQKEVFILYSDYYQHGSLSSLLHCKEKSDKYCDTWESKNKWIVSCCKALEYLHNREIIHKDVKPDNFLIQNMEQREVHITDFGISKIKQASTTYITTISAGHSNAASMIGSAQYMPPELYSAKFKTITDKQDIYSLGIVMWEICHLQKPFEGCNAMTIMGTVLNDEYPLELDENIPNKWEELMKWCWQKKPADRPTIMEVMCYLQKHKMELTGAK